MGKLDTVLGVTAKVLSAKDAGPQVRLNMSLFQVAAYLLRNEQWRVLPELGSFRDDYRNVPPDYGDWIERRGGVEMCQRGDPAFLTPLGRQATSYLQLEFTGMNGGGFGVSWTAG
jgi:hypothetical protein